MQQRERVSPSTIIVPELRTGHVISFSPTTAPQNPATRFLEGEDITRRNFAAWIKQSWALSRGVKQAQLAYLLWTAQRGNLDIPQTYANFAEKNIENLSSEERNIFLEPYKGIRAHVRIESQLGEVDDNTRLKVGFSILEKVAYKSQVEDVLRTLPTELQSFYAMPREEFMEKLKAYVTRVKTERRELVH